MLNYSKIPREVGANMRFRRKLLELAANDIPLQADIWSACKREFLFYVNTCCIAAGAPVVTDRGLVPIENVVAGDRVWDGESWVGTGGALFQGYKSTTFSYGVELTPDHKVWTKHGWAIAADRHDREAVRPPEGYSSWREVSQQPNGSLDMRLRVRPRSANDRRLTESGKVSQLREPWVSQRWEGDARLFQGQPGIPRLDGDEGPLLQPQGQGISGLWRARHFGLSAVDDLRELLGGHGRAAGWHDNRPLPEQQRKLRARQLPLGYAQAASKQYSAQPSDRYVARESICYPGGIGCRRHLRRDLASHQEWSKGRRRDCAEQAAPPVPVFDLINCGPNQAFTVIGADGQPTLVHNCWTYNPKQTWMSRIPFITWDYQNEAFERMQKAMDDGHDVVIEKSRDMGASWMMLTLFQWRWQFYPLQSFLMMSRKEDYVDSTGNPDSLFWKLDFLLEYQPSWLRPVFTRNQMMLVNVENKSVISGETTNQNAGRGGRRTAILIDEAAAITKLVDVDAATADVTDCRFWNSTPMGRNHFYRLRCSKAAEIIRLHWTSHPHKRKGLYTSE